MPFVKDFNEVMQEIIKINKEMTQTELASLCDVSPTAVMKWLAGGKVDMDNLKKICLATHRSPNEIMGYVEDNSFSKEEQEIILRFRDLPENIQEIVKGIIFKK